MRRSSLTTSLVIILIGPPACLADKPSANDLAAPLLFTSFRRNGEDGLHLAWNKHVGAYDGQRPWESCMTTSRRGQWAWGGQADGVKSLEDCLGMLIRCAGGDGNLLLNVAPMLTGEIAPEQANLFKEMGAWLAETGPPGSVLTTDTRSLDHCQDARPHGHGGFPASISGAV